MLTIRDLAREYGVDPSRVHHLIAVRKRKGLPDVGVQVGEIGMWLFQPEDVEKLRPRAKGGRPCKAKAELS